MQCFTVLAAAQELLRMPSESLQLQCTPPSTQGIQRRDVLITAHMFAARKQFANDALGDECS